MPFAALHLSYPVHLEFSMPSVDVSVEIESASWNARHNFFTAICVSHYLIDLLNPENAETDLSAYLSRQVKLAWDSFNNEADFSA